MKRFSYSFLIIILTLILIGVIIAVAKESYRKYQIEREIANIQKEIDFLKNKNESLSAFLDYLEHNSSLEKEARLKLNLLKEGEKLIIISSDKESTPEEQTYNNDTIEKSNFIKWQNYFWADD